MAARRTARTRRGHSRSNRPCLKAHLTTAGYAPELCNDGMEALDALERNPARYDVVLLDRNMPRMNGIELLGG